MTEKKEKREKKQPTFAEIPYKCDGKIMLTPCDCIIGEMIPKVGSALCKSCAYYHHRDDEKKIVYCKASHSRKRPFVGSKNFYMYNQIIKEINGNGK